MNSFDLLIIVFHKIKLNQYWFMAVPWVLAKTQVTSLIECEFYSKGGWIVAFISHRVLGLEQSMELERMLQVRALHDCIFTEFNANS